MRNEKLIFETAKERGWVYNPLTGVVTSHTGNIPKSVHKRTNKKTGLTYGYIRCSLYSNRKYYSFKSHRFAYWFMTGEIHEQIDHIKHCGDTHLMNIFTNLRPSTNQKNTFNADGVKGYSKIVLKSSIKYRSVIRLNGKLIHLGHFNTELEAREAYLKAKEKYHIIS